MCLLVAVRYRRTDPWTVAGPAEKDWLMLEYAREQCAGPSPFGCQTALESTAVEVSCGLTGLGRLRSHVRFVCFRRCSGKQKETQSRS